MSLLQKHPSNTTSTCHRSLMALLEGCGVLHLSLYMPRTAPTSSPPFNADKDFLPPPFANFLQILTTSFTSPLFFFDAARPEFDDHLPSSLLFLLFNVVRHCSPATLILPLYYFTVIPFCANAQNLSGCTKTLRLLSPELRLGAFQVYNL